ncbi:hypothetical protein [Kluyvera intermedia]|uniref:hypothetical protein n=1 Tax=Kluyvera intermedia TaxID=61648 RepID=UPI0034A260DA
MKHVANLTGLHWHTIKNIDCRRLQREVREPKRHNLHRLIKVIRRMAYGYRDNDYFFLKIKAAFPGTAR